jgi:hypothetical protein
MSTMTYYPEVCRSQPIWGARLGDVEICVNGAGVLEVRDRGATTKITSRLGEVLPGKTRVARDSVRALISVNLSFFIHSYVMLYKI